MTERQKILQVLKNIKHESEISPNPETAKFKFNASLIGQGVLTGDEEEMILRRIEKEGIIKLNLMDGDEEVGAY